MALRSSRSPPSPPDAPRSAPMAAPTAGASAPVAASPSATATATATTATRNDDLPPLPPPELTRHRGPVRRSDRRLCALPPRANRVDQRHRRGPFRSERGCRLRPAGRERLRHVDGRVHRAPTAQSENRALLRQISERAPILHDRLIARPLSSRRRARERDELAARDDALRDLSRATHLNPALVESRETFEKHHPRVLLVTDACRPARDLE